MTAKLADVNGYNARRYGTPWVCRVVAGKNDFIRGAYDGNDDGGIITIENPKIGQVYGFGQRDNRGGCSATYYVVWTGAAFQYCDRKGGSVDADHYAGMRHDNWAIIPYLDIQIKITDDKMEENEMVEVTGIKEAVKAYEGLKNKLSPRIMLDQETGEVWTAELISENDTITYRRESIADITADAIEEQMDQTLAAYKDNPFREGSMTPLADAVLTAARRACDAWAAEAVG